MEARHRSERTVCLAGESFDATELVGHAGSSIRRG